NRPTAASISQRTAFARLSAATAVYRLHRAVSFFQEQFGPAGRILAIELGKQPVYARVFHPQQRRLGEKYFREHREELGRVLRRIRIDLGVRAVLHACTATFVCGADRIVPSAW